MKRTYLFLLVITGCIVAGCYVFGLFHNRIPKEELDKICEVRGGLSSPGPLYVDGYYLPTASPLFGFDQVRTRLSKARFQFFEMDTAWVRKSGSWGDFNDRIIKGQGRYTRFYLAERGDPNCEVYEEYLKVSRGLAKKKVMLRAYGVYPDHCIAAVKTDELKSEYGIFTREPADPDIGEVTWFIDEIKNTKTGEVHSSFSEFQHCYKGRKSNGGCRGGSKETYSCPIDRKERRKDSKVIYYETFKATENPILEKNLTIEEIREPVTIETDLVDPELVGLLKGKENIKKLWRDEVLDLYKSMDGEGYAWFEYRDEPMEDGRTHNRAIAQLCVLRDEDRKLLKIDINAIGSPYSGGGMICVVSGRSRVTASISSPGGGEGSVSLRQITSRFLSIHGTAGLQG